GSACTTGDECQSGACVDGVCCDRACDVCGVCSVSAGADVDGQCKPLPAGAKDPACSLACDGEFRCASADLAAGAACNEHRECASGSCVAHVCCAGSPRSCLETETKSGGPSAFDAEPPGSGCSCSLVGVQPSRGRAGAAEPPTPARQSRSLSY